MRKGNLMRRLAGISSFILAGAMTFVPGMTSFAEETIMEEGTSAEKENGKGLLSLDITGHHTKKTASSAKPLLQSTQHDFPERYRADEQPWAEGIRVKDQDKAGVCWAFALTTCAEYSYAKETYDELGPVKELSPGHLAYFANNRRPDPLGNTDGDSITLKANWAEDGGHPYYGGLLFLSQWSGLCLEEKAPYSMVKDHMTDDYLWDGYEAPYADELAYDDYVVIENLDYRYSVDRDEIKEMIMDYGAVNGLLHMDKVNYMNENSFYNYEDSLADHGIVIVGWDDNYAKTNFTHSRDINGNKLIHNEVELDDEAAAKLTTPEGDGAWIIQNSWGDDDYDNGFFYVSYYSQDLPLQNVVGLDMQAADTYKYNFFYDGTEASIDSLDEERCKGFLTKKDTKAANVFQNTTDEILTLDAVGFTEYDEEYSEYDIGIYAELQDPMDPESGILVSRAKASAENPGIRTVKLDTPLYVDKESYFSVVISFPEDHYLAVEKSTEDDFFINQAEIRQGQSFFLNAGSDKWIDLEQYQACYRIRAFANPIETTPQFEVVKEPECIDIVYDGSEQKLVTEGKVLFGDMLYALGDSAAPTEAYSTEIPRMINPGEYYVWYKAKAAYSDEETEPACIAAEIAPRKIKITANDFLSIAYLDPSQLIVVDGLAETDRLTGCNYKIETDSDEKGKIKYCIVPFDAVITNQDQADVTGFYQIEYINGRLYFYDQGQDPDPVDPDPIPEEVTPEPSAAEEKEAFSSYKEEMTGYADSLGLSSDTEADEKLIRDAKAAIASLAYDESKSLAQNKKAVDKIIKQLKKDLQVQRESEKKTDYSSEWVKGKWYNKDGTQTYKPVGTWHKNKKGWWYEDESGWYPRNRWQKIDGKWYYFKSDGYAAAGEYVQGWWLNAKTCQCTYPYRAKWHRNQNGWWYGDASGWYARNGIIIINGTDYSFDRRGYLID